MTIMRVNQRNGERGFTLIEALIALALTGLVLSALATLTAQWLPNWNHGIDRIQRSEVLGIAMQRVAADLAAAEYVPASGDTKKPLFEGSALAVTFVRTALGPNVGIGLDLVRIGETADKGQFVTVRSRAPFAPLSPGVLPSEVHVAEPVVLLRSPLRLSLSYAGPDHVFHEVWHDMEKLPALIRLTVREAGSGRVLSVSTVATVHVDAAASTAKSDDDAKGDTKDGGKGDSPAAPAKPGENG